MGEYVLRSDILSALHSGTIDCGMVNAHTYFKLKELSEKIDRKIENVPAADVVTVVRCRDCKHNKREVIDLWGSPAIQCVTGAIHGKDWFCADGKKPEDEP